MLIQEARQKIQTSQLINRLQDHALGRVEMTKTQVSATSILLKKTLPDLSESQNVNITGRLADLTDAELESRIAECRTALAGDASAPQSDPSQLN